MENKTTTTSQGGRRYSSISILKKDFATLEKLSNKEGVSKTEYIRCAIKYFVETGLSPVNDTTPRTELLKIYKRIDQLFAFMKKQELEFIRPIYYASKDLKPKRENPESEFIGIIENEKLRLADGYKMVNNRIVKIN